jgi:hypothetical protein
MSNDSVSLIKKIHTVCKDCTFATYRYKTQIDCHINMLSKYKASDKLEVLEAYDDDKEFYIVNGKKCPGYKEENYFKSRNLQDLSLEEKASYVKSRIKLNYMAVINTAGLNITKFRKILQNLKKASAKPNMICLIINEESQYSYNQYMEYLNKSKIECKWRMQTSLIKEQTYDYILHNLTNTQHNYNFVLSINGNSTDANKIVDLANHLIYEKFENFQVIANKINTVHFYSSLVYKNAFAHGVDILSHQEEFMIV